MTDAVYIKGGRELDEFLRQLAPKYERNILRGAMRAGAKVIQPVAKALAAHKTGELAEGIKVTTSAKGGRVIGRVVLTGKHAFLGRWLEFTGAAPHVIAAGSGRVLFFGTLFAKSVRHPGFQPKPFLRPALDSQAGAAVLAAANYSKARLQTQYGLDTADINVELVG